jgi:response regulator RpfG family c-di-GMP phosphodiesterase
MNRPLFVHTDTRILDRITKESNETALVTSSMVHALQWITNPDVLLSGVFVSPDDSAFSTLRFIEITLTHRPILPIFLFEPSVAANYESMQKIMKNTHVRGVYSGTESFAALTSTLRENILGSDAVRKKAPETAQKPGYVALPITDFFTGSVYPYDVFILDPPNSMNLFSQKASAIDPMYLAKATTHSDFLYVKEQDVAKTKETLTETRKDFINSDLPFNWKTAELMANARDVLQEMKSAGVNEQLIEYTQSMLGDLFKLISKIDSDEGSIYTMIDKAKRCDRSVFCASYAILVCKQLGFEKTATLEILGLASVLQDVSLYRTPFGDLSEKTLTNLEPEETGIYLQHPTLSADLVSHHTDVPQVTLQVVRQHHERKDKTGYPNRVGGNQLHPMAEILSLINSYYEVSKALQEDALVIQELQKSVFPHYSDNIVQAFKTVLGNILKDKIQVNQPKAAEAK